MAQLVGPAQTVVAGAQAGDARAWEALFDEHYPRLYRFFRPRVACDADAEDLAAETFADAVRGIRGFRWRNRPFGAWLFAIARNRLRMYYRSRRVTVPLDTALLDHGLLDHGLLDGGLPHGVAGWHVDERGAADVRDILRRMRHEHRLVLELRYVLGLSGEEAAAAMGRSHGATRKLLQRASAEFRAHYSRAG